MRAIKRLSDNALRVLSPVFDEMYADSGRPSVPPERLLKGLLLIARDGSEAAQVDGLVARHVAAPRRTASGNRRPARPNVRQSTPIVRAASTTES
jgi:hypothetical protein